MYTQCPDCNAAFRVTADVLKQAVGKVRCGACGKAFNSLEFLSETRPQQASASEAEAPLPELTPDSRPSASSIERISPQQRATLQKTLDQLAGSDVRIEDTGIEWRVLDEHAKDASGIDELLDESPTPVDEFLMQTPTTVEASEIFENPTNPFTETIVDELRFDDNTPLPEDFDPDEKIIDAPESSGASQDDGDADKQNTGAATDDNADDAGEEDDWAAILGEFDEPLRPATPPLDAELAAIENAERLAGADTELDEQAEASTTEPGADGEPIDAPQGDSTHEAGEDGAGEDGVGEDTAKQLFDDDDAPLEFGSIGDSAESPPGGADQDIVGGESGDRHADDPQDDEFWNAGSHFSGAKQQLFAEADSSPGFESIVMEGEVVRSELDKEKLAADMAAAAEIAEKVRAAWDAENAEPTFGKPRGMTAALVALVALLLVQVVHQSREALATVPMFNSVVSPVYRAIGIPISPAWDITAWRFEATRGSTDDNNEKLTIYSRVGNTSERSAPYPLIGITLTDRFEATVGSRILQPWEYLGGDLDLARPVASGDTFDAVISIQSPPGEATGFKLKVCYPLSGGKHRCAVDGFK